MATDLPLAFVKRNEREGRRAERMGEGVEKGGRGRMGSVKGVSAVNQPMKNLMKDACEKKCRLNG